MKKIRNRKTRAKKNILPKVRTVIKKTRETKKCNVLCDHLLPYLLCLGMAPWQEESFLR